ncbi:MAG: FAD-dependent oxidoreductase [Coriobacteriia bacterium]
MSEVSTGCTTPAATRRVVVAGGGYAGTTCAVALGRALRRHGGDIEVLVVEPNPCQQALSELDLVAVGPPRPQFCELWHPTVFKDLPVRVCYERVAQVRPDEHLVVVGEGHEVPYWRLVIATGAIPSVPPIPGLREHAITMWSVEDAQRLQQAIEAAFKTAARLPDASDRRRALGFAVVGGGATGVEIVGTLGRMLPIRMRDAGLDPADLTVCLIEARPDILYDLPQRLRTVARAKLERLGVVVVTDAPVSGVEPGKVGLGDGRDLDASVLVWAGGAHADPHAVEWGLRADPTGRLVTDACLLAEGRDDVYVIGDVAASRDPKTGRVLPMLAQIAIQAGPHAASNLLREAAGSAPLPFEPHLRGEFVSIGPRDGVGWMYGALLSGLAAITMKRITYVKYWLQVGGVRLALKRTREMVAMQR